MIYFTADTHFGHENVIRFCGRPYATAAEMDEALVESWNSRVKGNDTVLILQSKNERMIHRPWPCGGSWMFLSFLRRIHLPKEIENLSRTAFSWRACAGTSGCIPAAWPPRTPGTLGAVPGQCGSTV